MQDEVLTVTTVDALDVHLVRAGVGSRAYAFLIDWHIRAIAAVVWFLGAVFVLGLGLRESVTSFSYGAALPALAIYFLYHPVLEVLMQGQTPGKRWIHVRVVTAQGAPASTGAHLLRNLFRIIDGMPGFYALGLAAMMFTRDQVRIGDLATGTVVVYEAPATGFAAAILHDRVPPAIARLLEEWLERWDQLDPSVRDGIGMTLLAKVPDPALAVAARQYSGASLRDQVRQLLNENPATA